MYDPQVAINTSAVRLVDAIFDPADWVNIRLIESWDEAGPDGNKKRESQSVANHNIQAGNLAAEWSGIQAISAAKRCNVYFCVCPRPTRFTNRNKAEHTQSVRTVWADIDHVSPTEAVRRMKLAGLPKPSAVVNSGHGVHAYWLLAEPYYVAQWPGKSLIEPCEDARRVMRVICGIGDRIGGDNVYDLARLLRLPGSLNRKNQRNGVPPIPCELLHLDADRRYTLAELEHFAVDLPVRSTSQISTHKGTSDTKERKRVTGPDGAECVRYGDLSPGQRDRLDMALDRTCEDDDRSRSEFSTCCFAAKCRLHPDDLYGLMTGVSKVGDRGREYFDRTYARAWEAVHAA